ncbi:PaaI family thioesterase [Rhodococcus sp. NPDC058521]|uniref:PaaI family thioesterase n=1 Tax=Rhodococcus sp. NPDC058521 TaxID=3346536 RepID=UPI0036564E93
MTTTTIDDANAVLASQPFSVLVGARIARYGPDGVTLEVPLRAELLQQFGFAHGGVLSYTADNALTFAAGLALGPSIVTTGFTIDYLRPAKGELLRAEAKAVNASKRQALCRCDIYVVSDSGEAKLCAAAQGSARLIELK